VLSELALENDAQDGLGESHEAVWRSVGGEKNTGPSFGRLEGDSGMDWQRALDHPQCEDPIRLEL
jgi:hypothetical protein